MRSHVLLTLSLIFTVTFSKKSKKVDWQPIDKTWSKFRENNPSTCNLNTQISEKLFTITQKLILNQEFNSKLTDSSKITKKAFTTHIEKPTDFYFTKIESNLKPLWKIIIENVRSNIFKDSEVLDKSEFESGLLENVCITKAALQSSKPVYSRKDAGKFLDLVIEDLGLGMFAKPLVKTAGNKYIDDLFKKCDFDSDKELSDKEQDCLLVEWFIPTLLKVDDKEKTEL